MITTHLDASMKKSGVDIVSLALIKEVVRDEATKLLTIVLQDNRVS